MEVSVDDITERDLADSAARLPAGPRSAEAEVLDALPDNEIRAAMATLPEGFGAAMYYADVQGYTYAETAAILDIPREPPCRGCPVAGNAAHRTWPTSPHGRGDYAAVRAAHRVAGAKWPQARRLSEFHHGFNAARRRRRQRDLKQSDISLARRSTDVEAL